MASPEFDKFAEYISSDVVTIFVGPKRKRYTVHKKLLCEKSRYFEKALQEGFKEGQANAIYQKDETPECFDLFVRWIYKDSIPQVLAGPAALVTRAYLELYVMADKMCLTALKNATMDYLTEWSKTHYHRSRNLRWIYANTAPGSLLRKLPVDFTVWKIKTKGLLKAVDEGDSESAAAFQRKEHLRIAIQHNSDFAFDLVCALDSKTGDGYGVAPWVNRDAYHETDKMESVGK